MRHTNYVGTGLWLFSIFLLGGCASNPVTVIESSSGRSLPSWTERQTYEEGGKTYFVGAASVESGSASACLIVADEKSLSEAGRNIANSFVDQFTTVESSDEPSAKRIISSLRTERPLIEGLAIIDRYSQLVQVRAEAQGYSRTERRCWTLSAAPSRNVQSAIAALSRRLSGAGARSELDDITKQQRDQAAKK